nr:putative capsid [Marmot picobirnavirus]
MNDNSKEKLQGTNPNVSDSQRPPQRHQNVQKSECSKKGTKRNYPRKNRNGAGLDATNRDNDPNWYFEDASVASQAASISFNQFQGEPFTINQISADGIIERAINVANLFIARVNPSAGDTSSVTSGINLAALKTFTTLSSRNAKTTQYAPQDLTTLLLALGEVVSIAEHIRRAFGLAFTYNVRNRDLPRQLLLELGFNADDLFKGLADYRLRFNTIVTSINKIPFPANIAYLFKCADIYQHIYVDSNSPMAELIALAPYSTWTLDEAYSSAGTGLRTTALPSNTAPFGDWLDLLSNMTSVIMQSATFNYVYADVLNYADKTGAKLIFLDYLSEAYSVFPEFNQNFLLQIHNATWLGAPTGTASTPTYTIENDVAPNADKNKVDYIPLFQVNEGVAPTSVILDLPDANPSTENIIEATRFTMIPWLNNGDNVLSLAFSDHYIVSFSIKKNGVGAYSITSSWRNVDAPTAADVEIPCDLAQLDWAPQIYMDYSPSKALFNSGDLNYFTTIEYNWLNRVNDLTFQALFNLR